MFQVVERGTLHNLASLGNINEFKAPSTRIGNFFFPDSKISTSTRTCIQIKFARPRASNTYRYLDTLPYAGLLWGRRRLRKRHLKSEFVLLRTFISPIRTRSSSDVGKCFGVEF